MYETLSKFAQTGGLVLFIIAFVLVLIYALNPRKKEEFEAARQIPLNDEEPSNG